MVYRYKDYKKSFSVNLKSIKKNMTSDKWSKHIIECLSSKKYPSIDSFYAENGTLNRFIRSYLKSKSSDSIKYSDNVLMHFNNGITEYEYQQIINSIRNYIGSTREVISEPNEQRFVPLRQLISNIDELDKKDVRFVRDTLEKIDDVDDISIDIKNKTIISNSADKDSGTASKTEGSKQKILSSMPGSKHFYEEG